MQSNSRCGSILAIRSPEVMRCGRSAAFGFNRCAFASLRRRNARTPVHNGAKPRSTSISPPATLILMMRARSISASKRICASGNALTSTESPSRAIVLVLPILPGAPGNRRSVPGPPPRRPARCGCCRARSAPRGGRASNESNALLRWRRRCRHRRYGAMRAGCSGRCSRRRR